MGSRQAPDRADLQRRLLKVLGEVSASTGVDLAVTLGDEFQGRFPTVHEAVAAAWRLHLGVSGFARLRVGIGWGEILVAGDAETPFGEDGPAWWHARDAIDELAGGPGQARTRVRTGTRLDELINSFLILRDANLEMMDEVDAVIVAGLTEGETQRSLAQRLGLHESSVSRRVSRRRLASLAVAAQPVFELGCDS